MSLESFIKGELAALLSIDPSTIDPSADFSEQNVDSLMGMRLIRKIQDHTGSEIDPEWLFDYPSITELASFLEAELS